MHYYLHFMQKPSKCSTSLLHIAMPLLAPSKIPLFYLIFQTLQHFSFSLQKFNNGTKGKAKNYLNYKYFQCPLLNFRI